MGFDFALLEESIFHRILGEFLTAGFQTYTVVLFPPRGNRGFGFFFSFVEEEFIHILDHCSHFFLFLGDLLFLLKFTPTNIPSLTYSCTHLELDLISAFTQTFLFLI